MTIEDAIKLLSKQVDVCCPDMNARTMCFDCRTTLKNISLVLRAEAREEECGSD